MAFRVVTVKGTGKGLVASRAVIELVAVWHYLSQQQGIGNLGNGSGPGYAHLNGTFYAHSLDFSCNDLCAPGQSEYVEFNLSRHCVTFEAVAGVDDTSQDSQATATAEVADDGHIQFSQNITFGSVTPIELDVTNMLRIHLEITADSTWGQADTAAFGNARVLCTF